ncbi:hypothetical protein KKC44_00145 [Patescibacteria group bacterium]|nr:hypothetical protein [Patescibacteria group bacterium]
MTKTKMIILKLLAAFLLIAGLISVAVYFYDQNFKAQREDILIEIRDFDRTSHVNTLAGALGQYRSDHDGKLPLAIDTEGNVCRVDIYSDCSGLIDLGFLLEDYLVAIPVDPLADEGPSSDYSLQIGEDYSIHINAPRAESGPIAVTR